MRKWIVLSFLWCTALFAEVPMLNVLSIPKSGTHLMLKLIALLDYEGTSRISGDYRHFYMRSPWLNDDIIDAPNLKRVVMIRNLRDVVVSYVHYMSTFDESKLHMLKKNDVAHYLSLRTFSEKLAYVLTPGNDFNATLVNNCQGCLRALKNPANLVIRFEELVGSAGGGSDEQQLKAILKVVDYMNLEIPSDYAMSRIRGDLFGVTLTFRKGQIGSWREEFTREHEILFEQTFGTFNRELGY